MTKSFYKNLYRINTHIKMKQTINNTFFCAIIIKIDQWRSCKTWERSKKWGPEKNSNLIENIDVTYSCHILPSYILLCLLAIVLFTLIMFFFFSFILFCSVWMQIQPCYLFFFFWWNERWFINKKARAKAYTYKQTTSVKSGPRNRFLGKKNKRT